MSKSRCSGISPCHQGRCPHGKVCGNKTRCIGVGKKRWKEVCSDHRPAAPEENVGEIYERDKDCLDIMDEGECDSHPMCVYTHRRGRRKSSCGSKRGVRQGDVYQGPMFINREITEEDSEVADEQPQPLKENDEDGEYSKARIGWNTYPSPGSYERGILQDFMGQIYYHGSGLDDDYQVYEEMIKKRQIPWGAKTPKEVRQHLNQLKEEMFQEEIKLLPEKRKRVRFNTIKRRLKNIDRILEIDRFLLPRGAEPAY